MRIDTLTLKKLTHPTPGGLSEPNPDVAMFVVVWLCGCVVVWLCGCVVVWMCGCVVVWLCGCVVVWLCGCVVVWLCGCVVVWLCELFTYLFRDTTVGPRPNLAHMCG